MNCHKIKFKWTVCFQWSLCRQNESWMKEKEETCLTHIRCTEELKTKIYVITSRAFKLHDMPRLVSCLLNIWAKLEERENSRIVHKRMVRVAWSPCMSVKSDEMLLWIYHFSPADTLQSNLQLRVRCKMFLCVMWRRKIALARIFQSLFIMKAFQHCASWFIVAVCMIVLTLWWSKLLKRFQIKWSRKMFTLKF